MIETLCVYCGSSTGVREDYADAARQLAQHLAQNGVGLVYGGASRGLMGVMADAMLAAGGRVAGVIPAALQEKEIAHPDLDELHVVRTMHERKALMSDLSDAFLAMPGGFGTLEEIVEMLTWAQLGIHAKPCGLLDIGGYFDALLGWVEHAEAEGFLRPQHRHMLQVIAEPSEVLACFAGYRAPAVHKWLR